MAIDELTPSKRSSIHSETTYPAPRTELGKRLWELRPEILACGTPVLTWDQIEQELRERRGERNLEDTTRSARLLTQGC